MKKIFSILAILPFYLSAQICTPSSNVVLFTNYDGGILNINVDVNIPNLKIGIVSYEAVQINFSGPFVNNITEVRYAGYNNSNNNCGQSIFATSFSGLPVGAVSSITFAPPAPVSDPNGYGSIICAYSCNASSNQGGCNTVDQVVAYFYQIFNVNALYSHTIQYGCWTGTQNTSAGGNCCPVAPPTPITSTISGVNNNCSGFCNGSATVVPSGGASPYSYAWSANANNASTATVNNLCAGNYSVTVTDALGAQTTSSITITAPSAIFVTENITNALCNGQTGSITLGITGGVPPYSTNWNGVDPLQVPAGTYSVIVTDANACQNSFNYTIDEPSVITGTFTINPNVGNCNGSMTIAAQGGNPPYTYNWSGFFEPSATLSALCGAEYCVEVTDASGCKAEFCAFVPNLVGIEQHVSNQYNYSIAPNPSTESTTLTIESAIQQPLSISIVDPSGREIYTKTVQVGESGLTEINIDAPSGVYFINIISEAGEIETLKWVRY
jgi:hypothetical protein